MKVKSIILILLSCILTVSCAVKNNKEIKKEAEVQPKVVLEEVVKVPVISFEVQIGAFDTKNNAFSSVENVKEIFEESLYKYRLSSFEKYRKARKYRRSLLKKYPDAFVQALKDGKPVTIKEALRY